MISSFTEVIRNPIENLRLSSSRKQLTAEAPSLMFAIRKSLKLVSFRENYWSETYEKFLDLFVSLDWKGTQKLKLTAFP